MSDSQRIDEGGDILMWSHYGKGHTGFRLHFDREYLDEISEVCWDIEYETDIPYYDGDYDIMSDMGGHEAYQALSSGLRAKGHFWSYEKETRFFFSKDMTRRDRAGGFDYVRLPSCGLLRVDIGIETSEEAEYAMVDALDRRKWDHVEVFYAQRIKGRFGIEYIPYW